MLLRAKKSEIFIISVKWYIKIAKKGHYPSKCTKQKKLVLVTAIFISVTNGNKEIMLNNILCIKYLVQF